MEFDCKRIEAGSCGGGALHRSRYAHVKQLRCAVLLDHAVNHIMLGVWPDHVGEMDKLVVFLLLLLLFCFSCSFLLRFGSFLSLLFLSLSPHCGTEERVLPLDHDCLRLRPVHNIGTTDIEKKSKYDQYIYFYICKGAERCIVERQINLWLTCLA